MGIPHYINYRVWIWLDISGIVDNGWTSVFTVFINYLRHVFFDNFLPPFLFSHDLSHFDISTSHLLLYIYVEWNHNNASRWDTFITTKFQTNFCYSFWLWSSNFCWYIVSEVFLKWNFTWSHFWKSLKYSLDL